MIRIKLGNILFEQKQAIGIANGENLQLIGVSNEVGLHKSKAKRIDDLSRYKLIQNGWFAYNPMRINVGSIGYAFQKDHIGIVSPDYIVFSCSEKILPEYLLYLLKSDEGIEAINKNASGAVRKRLYFSDLARIEILLPSIESQKKRLRLFRKAKNIEGQISKHLSKNGNLSQLKQSILQEAIQGKLTREWRNQNSNIKSANELLKQIKSEKEKQFKEKRIKKEKQFPKITKNEIPFELPKGWVWCRFSHLVTYRKGKKPTVLVKSKSSKYSIPYIDIEAFERGNFKQYTNDPKAVLCEENNILLVWDGSRMGLVGKNCRGAVGSTLAKIEVFNSNVDFLFYLLKSKFHYFNSNPKQAGMPHMNGPLLDRMIVGLPPTEEQNLIVQKIELLMKKCRVLEIELSESSKYAYLLTQAILREAFEGKSVDTEKKSGKVFKLKPTNGDYYKRTLLAAEIVHQLHQEPTLGHLKLQKLIYLTQKSGKMALPTNFLKQAMGPYDPQMARSIDSQLKKRQWYEYKRDQSPKYEPLTNAGEHTSDFEKYFANEATGIRQIINLFRKAKSDAVEIVATLYACWEEILDKNEILSDNLLIQRFYEWSEEKSKYQEKTVREWLAFMREKGITPVKQ